MFKMIGRILSIAGRNKYRIILGMVFNFLKSVSIPLFPAGKSSECPSPGQF